jgi:putative flippase GtrA
MDLCKIETRLRRLVLWLPPSWQRRATPARLRVLAQFLMFGIVGLAGLVVDTGTVYGLRGWLGLYGAGLAAYATGATTTWWLNRHWTFRGHAAPPARPHRQWALFMAANSAGFVLNRGTYFALVTYVAACARQPVLATSAGAIAGMFVNFGLSRRIVFRPAVPRVTDA